MPELKSTTSLITHVNWMRDMDVFVQEVFGCRRPFVLTEAANYTYRRVNLNPDRFLEYDRQRYEGMKKQGCCEEYHLEILLTGLAFEGHIPFADYLIRIFW